MQILKRIKRLWESSAEPAELEQRSHPSFPDPGLDKFFGSGSDSVTGINVDANKALTYPAVWAAVKVMSDTIASLPLFLFRRDANGQDKHKATSHPLFRLLHDQPNPMMTSYQWRNVMMLHALLRGNGISEIIRDGNGQVAELWPWNPDNVRIESKGFNLTYWFTVEGQGEVPLPPERVLHLTGLSQSGLVGMSTLTALQETVALGLAAEEMGGSLFGNGARISGLITPENDLDEDAMNALRESFNEKYAGAGNKARVAISPKAAKFEKFTIDPDEAQFNETRKLQVTEAARTFNVQPDKIGDLERATFSNVEQQAINFVVYTLRPWLVNFEQLMNKDLIVKAEKPDLFFEFSVNALLRGDVATRFASYRTALETGVFKLNEIRAFENVNSVEGGDVNYRPMNLTPVNGEEAQVEPEPNTPPPSADGDEGEDDDRTVIPESIEKRIKGNGKAISGVS